MKPHVRHLCSLVKKILDKLENGATFNATPDPRSPPLSVSPPPEGGEKPVPRHVLLRPTVEGVPPGPVSD